MAWWPHKGRLVFVNIGSDMVAWTPPPKKKKKKKKQQKNNNIITFKQKYLPLSLRVKSQALAQCHWRNHEETLLTH